MSYDLIASLDEAPIVIESPLSMKHNLALDQEQVFHNGEDMQHVLEVGLFSIISEWNIPDMLYWMSPIITCLDISEMFGFP